MNLTNSMLALALVGLPAGTIAIASHDDTSALIQKLGDKDYKVRRDAFKKLEDLGDTARAALETAAKSDDAEIRWNASRLLDRLEDQGDTGARGGLTERPENGGAPAQDDADRGGPAPDLEQQMKALEEHMKDFEKLFNSNGNGFFHFTPFHMRLFDQDFGEGAHAFDLKPNSSFERSSSVDGKTESLSIKVDANGHVTAEHVKDGKTTRYESDSVDAFRKEHGDLLRMGPATIAIDPFTAPPRVRSATPGLAPSGNGSDVQPRRRLRVKTPVVTTPAPAPAEEAPKPRLGVELSPVAPAVAEYLDLDGDALQIVRVMDDMPAAKRGLKVRDILLEVNGKEVHQFDDVMNALKDADPATVPLVVLRRGQRKEL
jgi:hypothetical protein